MGPSCPSRIARFVSTSLEFSLIMFVQSSWLDIGHTFCLLQHCCFCPSHMKNFRPGARYWYTRLRISHRLALMNLLY